MDPLLIVLTVVLGLFLIALLVVGVIQYVRESGHKDSPTSFEPTTNKMAEAVLISLEAETDSNRKAAREKWSWNENWDLKLGPN